MTAKQQPAQAAPAPAANLDAIAQFNGMNYDAYAQAAQALMRGVTAINEELMSFTSTQFRDGAKVSQAVLNSGDLGEAMRLQMTTTQEASERYFREANRLIEMTAKLCRECCTPLELRAREMMDEVEAATRELPDAS